MRGYLAPVAGDAEVPVESVTEVYRDPGETQRVLADTEDGTVPLGVRDATVSRRKNDQAPVVFVPRSECIEVHNKNNSNGVTIDPNGAGKELSEGQSRRVRDSTTVQIGYQTTLELAVKQDAQFGTVEGDVVMGSQTNVEDAVVGPNASIESGDGNGGTTTVDDSVVGPDADVGGGGSTEVSDSVVSPRSNVGGSQGRRGSDGTGMGGGPGNGTKKFCEDHQRTYTGERCPACVAESESEPDGQVPNVPKQDSDQETKYCIHCGEAIPAVAKVCPQCGENQ